MKNLSEQINWQKQFENRKWKRITQSIELALLTLMTFTVIGVIFIYGNGTKFQPVFIGFSIVLACSTACLIPLFFKGYTFNRWQVFVITLGLGCGAAITALAALLMLELQLLTG
ncbi:hypothetical protein [Marinicellulosiphila megalodicopiae]|uniref:hypothetical protein n=1 Tax=Marinicellulosiphila megalodicopiae TaxID=2724896 RepID=UPI003BB1DAB2